jgi:hypothetical protein
MALYANHGADNTWPYANGFGLLGTFCNGNAAGTAYNTSVAATNVEPTLAGATGLGTTQGTYPAGYLNQVGKMFRVKAGGIMTNTGTPTLLFQILLGTTSIAKTATGTQAGITGTLPWEIEVNCVVNAGGATGTVLSIGKFTYYTTAPVIVQWAITNATPGTGDVVDLTASLAFHLQATWGTSNASNNLTCDYFYVEFLN